MLGRILLTADAVMLLLGAPIADYGPTHMFNPNWPPHAKFHNGQTINLSLILGVATLYYTWRSTTTGTETTAAAAAPKLKKEYMRVAAFTGSIYWIAGIAAILYPGTMGLDPEFGGPGFPQAPVFTAGAVFALLGAWLDTPSKAVVEGKVGGKGE